MVKTSERWQREMTAIRQRWFRKMAPRTVREAMMITDTFVRQFSVNGGYKSLELVIEYPHPPTLRDFLNEGEIGKKLDALGAEGVRLARHTHIQAAREAVFARLFPRIPTRPAPFVPFGLLDSGESDDD